DGRATGSDAVAYSYRCTACPLLCSYGFYVNSALGNPFIVGTHWFQLADQAVTGRSDGENYQAGFLTVGDSPQQEIVRVARETGRNMYEFRNRFNDSE
ncbi:MAG: hypothetical protein R6W31_03470, partial [Bacteroidales bacterium]